VCHSGRRGAWLARREERAYRAYVSDEQRRQPGCLGGQDGALISDQVLSLTGTELLVLVLRRTYWFVAIGLFVVVAVFVRDRACFDPLNLMPAIARQPAAAWFVASVYLAGHCWLAAAYGVTARLTGRLLPTRAQARSVKGPGVIRMTVMASILLLEVVPPGIWTAIFRAGPVCG
jgi:hypothetical protein